MDKTVHLTEDELILFMDRELDTEAAAAAERHLLACVECGQRLKDLKRGSAAYADYRRKVLEPAFPVPVSGWAGIGVRPAARKAAWSMWFAAAAALLGVCVFAWLYVTRPAQPEAESLLARATAAPEAGHGSLEWTAGSRRIPEARVSYVHALFVKANYDWQDPLSARSFAAWRRQLPRKRDLVTAIEEASGQRLFRVRTSTDSGILNAASLTLEAATYHPTRASFEFQGEDTLDVTEQTAPTPEAPKQETKNVQPAAVKPIETMAGPEDELRVFAALDAIGADAEEPIDVKLDAGHHAVLVTAMGMPAARQKQIEDALAGLPNTAVRFSSAQSLTDDVDKVAPNEPDSDSREAFRQKLQTRAGGARQLQALTDGAIETTNALFAQAHSLLTLAQEFPSGVEGTLTPQNANTLLALRQRRVGAMEYAMRQLKDELKPLINEETMPEPSKLANWQSGGPTLFEATRNLDRLVSRLLAGSYTEQAGETMLQQLPGEMARVEALIRTQSAAVGK